MSGAKMDFTPSSFGGGWLVPLDSNAEDLGRDYFAEDASDLAALGGAVGWIVEPQDLSAAVVGLMALGCEVTL